VVDFPAARYVSSDPDCPAGRKHVCIGWLPEKQERVDPATGKRRHVWAYGCAVFHYGATAQEAEYKLKAWVEAQKEAELKLQIRVTKQQGKLAQERATAAREAESALWGVEERPA
jgi:hypothetical protein